MISYHTELVLYFAIDGYPRPGMIGNYAGIEIIDESLLGHELALNARQKS